MKLEDLTILIQPTTPEGVAFYFISVAAVLWWMWRGARGGD